MHVQAKDQQIKGREEAEDARWKSGASRGDQVDGASAKLGDY